VNEFAEKNKIFKVWGILVRVGAIMDVMRFRLGEARTFSEYVHPFFELNFSKNKCFETCSMHDFSRRIRIRVRQKKNWGKKKGAEKLFPP
jgi:hypothetical protein